MIRITPDYDESLFKKRIAMFKKRLCMAIELELSYLGEELANYAKENHNYIDRSGNLTNSIGYYIIKDGKILKGKTVTPIRGLEKEDYNPKKASDRAKSVAKEFADQITHSYALIVVAGMEYASYIEAKGYNVILPAQFMCMKEFPKRMENLRNKVKERINNDRF